MTTTGNHGSWGCMHPLHAISTCFSVHLNIILQAALVAGIFLCIKCLVAAIDIAVKTEHVLTWAWYCICRFSIQESHYIWS